MTVNFNSQLVPAKLVQDEVEQHLIPDFARIVYRYLFTANYKVEGNNREHSFGRKRTITIYESFIEEEPKQNLALNFPILIVPLHCFFSAKLKAIIEGHLRANPTGTLGYLRWYQQNNCSIEENDPICQWDIESARFNFEQAKRDISPQKMELEIGEAKQRIFERKAGPIFRFIRSNPYYGRIREKVDALIAQHPEETQVELRRKLNTMGNLSVTAPLFSIIRSAQEAVFKEVEQEIRLFYSSQQ